MFNHGNNHPNAGYNNHRNTGSFNAPRNPGFNAPRNPGFNNQRNAGCFTAPQNPAPTAHPNAFPLYNRPRPCVDRANNVSCIPKENDVVYSTRYGQITLGQEIGRGGEGFVYRTNCKLIAKIYRADTNTVFKFEKLKLLTSRPLKCDGICGPVDILYNANREFVGYLMEEAQGIPLSSFAIRPVFTRYFPGWRKRDLVELCVTILKMIKFLHNRNIIMGDINLSNILVKSPTEVYFLDVDSFQVQDLPCPVGTLNFTPPELHKFNSFRDVLRNFGNENYSIAVLLFTLLLPGQFPYHQKGDATDKENIMNMAFPYPLGAIKNNNLPDGPWRFMWSHLPADVKKAFYHTFAKGGCFTKISERLNASEWKKLMQTYLSLLDSGLYGKQDEMSEEIYPTRFKKHLGSVIVRCTHCGNETDQKYVDENGVCLDCRRNQSLATGEPMRPVNRPIPSPRPRYNNAAPSGLRDRLNNIVY